MRTDRIKAPAATLAACGLLLAGTPAATAGPLLTLDASARAAVANDEMQVTLAAERDGTQLAELNDAVLAQLDAALREAKATPGVRSRLGSLWTQPHFSRDGKPAGWRVRGEVVLESGDQPALARLAGRLAERLQLAGVQFRLSEPKRRQEETRLLAEAAANFRQRAADAAAAFGFAGYDIREMTLNGAARSRPPRSLAMPRLAESSAAMGAVAPLPAEGGDSDVVMSVSGTVELK